MWCEITKEPGRRKALEFIRNGKNLGFILFRKVFFENRREMPKKNGFI
jgi:hypothetical protein